MLGMGTYKESVKLSVDAATNTWPGRLVARIPPFQGEEAGSKPVRATIYFQSGYFLVDII